METAAVTSDYVERFGGVARLFGAAALERLRAPSLQAAAPALVAFAKAHGAHELHAVAARDPWTLEADAALRQLAAAEGIAVSLAECAAGLQPGRDGRGA